MGAIAEHLQQVREQIVSACERANRDPAGVTLVAVSKTRTPLEIAEAAAAGVQHFGENRVEEFESKRAEVRLQVRAPLVWHMIGHVQSRKARDVVPLFDVVHSIDSVKLAAKFSRLVEDLSAQRPLTVLLQVNVSGEETKSGFDAVGWAEQPTVRETLWQRVDEVLELPGLSVCGLMTMAPIVEDMEEARPVFARLASLRDALQESKGIDLPELSMGMTDDFPVAIEEGATMVRIGRAIFGERDY